MVKLKVTTKKKLRDRNLQSYTETTKAALAVQRWYRGWVARREVGKVRSATIRIQAGGRGMLGRRRLRHENAQAEKIQCLYRGHRARRKVSETIQEQTCDLAATMVQSRLRAVIHRRRLRKTLRCAVKLQAAWRGYYVRRRFREEYDRKAQIIIQSRMFESKKVQWYLERERQVMRGKIAVFREWAHSAGKRRALARQRDMAAVALQRCFRGYLARRERARLRNERQRGKELAKFVELLRSHMSMVIFEEKERHTLAFPVRGSGKVGAGGGRAAATSAGGGRWHGGRDDDSGHGPTALASSEWDSTPQGPWGATGADRSNERSRSSQGRGGRKRMARRRDPPSSVNSVEMEDARALANLLELPGGSERARSRGRGRSRGSASRRGSKPARLLPPVR
jgi:hypothetical protein|eukprot:COSAG01_NODE_10991_length_2031_cov_3.208592_1_plen_396_part_00